MWRFEYILMTKWFWEEYVFTIYWSLCACISTYIYLQLIIIYVCLCEAYIDLLANDWIVGANVAVAGGGGLGIAASASPLVECIDDIWLVVNESGDWMIATFFIIGVDVCRTKPLTLSFLFGLTDRRLLFCKIDEQFRIENTVSDNWEFVFVDECCWLHSNCIWLDGCPTVSVSGAFSFSHASFTVPTDVDRLAIFCRLHFSILNKCSIVSIV